jgi:hypothetical protein
VDRTILFTALLLALLALTGCGPKAKTEADTNTPNAKPGDGAKQPAVAKVDLAKGPNGEVIVQVDEGKERKSGYKSKSGKTVIRHGPCVLFYDQLDGKKRWEGDYYDGALHGKMTGWHKDGTLWFERWFEKGKPVGTHKGYGKGGKVVWELSFNDGKPNISEVDCYCVVCQVAFLFGTPTWDWMHPNNENCTVYKFTNATRSAVSSKEFSALLGKPHSTRPRPKGILPFEEIVFQCKDGTVSWVVMTNQGELMADSLLKVSGRRKF